MSNTETSRDRRLILCGLALITVLAWIDTIYLAGGLGPFHWSMTMAMPERHAWTMMDLGLTFGMWTVMMVAMMLPSAAPFLLLFAEVNRRRHPLRQGNSVVPTSLFLLGYLTVWTGFSLLATLAQWGLHNALLLSSMMASTSPLMGGGLLVLAGIFQWTKLKEACLVRCQNPLHFLMTSWRKGRWGALQMGILHGMYCLLCCWLLMLLLFVNGVMNLLWVAGLSVFVLIEKGAGQKWKIRQTTGLVLILAGVWMVLAS